MCLYAVVGIDWGNVAGWGAVCATITVLAVGRWFTVRDRTRAHFVISPGHMQAPDPAHLAEIDEHLLRDGLTCSNRLDLAIANCGDGVAYQVEVGGEGVADALLFMPNPIRPDQPLPWRSYPRIAPGEFVIVFWWHEDPDELWPRVDLRVSWKNTPVAAQRKRDETLLRLNPR